jgi:hypothetical protein
MCKLRRGQRCTDFFGDSNFILRCVPDTRLGNLHKRIWSLSGWGEWALNDIHVDQNKLDQLLS